MTKKIAQVLFLLVTVAFAPYLQAQPAGIPITIGEQLNFQSTVLGEQRSVIVGLPQSYQGSDTSYPVLYLLDGASHFNYIAGVVYFLAANDFIPEMIVVAVNNTDRNRDLTPPSQAPIDLRNAPTLGGADNFQRFLDEELMPWVETNYRTQSYRVLLGHSFGGLFAVHTLTTRPELFNAYIAISPSMQWNGQGLVEQAEQYLSTIEQLPVSLYMTAGNEGGALLGGTRKLAGVLDVSAPKEFLWQFEHMPEQTHGSVPLLSAYHGLEFVYANWLVHDPYKMYKLYGIEAIEDFYTASDERYGTSRGVPFITIIDLMGSMMRNGDLDGAVALMNRPSIQENALAGQFGFVGNMLRERGDQAEATRFYRIALQKNPGDVVARGALDEWGVDYSDLIPQIEVDSRTLQNYEGVYSSSNTGNITVLVDNGRLYRELNSTRFELHPLSDTEFYLQEDDVRYRFQLASSGEVKGIQIRQGSFFFFVESRK